MCGKILARIAVVMGVAWIAAGPAVRPVPAAGQIRAYNCSSEPHEALSLRDVGDCPPATKVVEKRKVRATIAVLTVARPEELLRCRVEVHREVWHCGMQSHVSIMAPRTRHPLVLTTSTCHDLHAGHIWNFQGESIALKRGRTSGTLTLGGEFMRASGTCTGDVIQVFEYDILLTLESVEFSIPDRTIRAGGLTLPYDNPCDAVYGCLVVRDLAAPTCDQGELQQLYVGEVEEYQVDQRLLVLVSGEQQGALEVKARTVVCNTVVFATNERRLFYATEGVPPLPPARPMSLPLYLSAQLSSLHYHSAADRHQMLQLFSQRLCSLEQEMLRNRLALLRTEPDVISHAEYSDIMGPGIGALKAGEVLYLFQCTEVLVEARSTPGACYEYLPVHLDGQALFVEPFTHVLTGTSPAVSCFTPLRPLFQIGGRWYDAHTKQAAAPPRQLDPSRPLQVELPSEFRPNGLMTEESYQAFRASLQSPSRRKAAASIFADVAFDPTGSPLERPEYTSALGNLREGLAAVTSTMERVGAWCGLLGMVFFLSNALHASIGSFMLWRALTAAGESLKNRLLAFCFFDSAYVRHMASQAHPSGAGGGAEPGPATAPPSAEEAPLVDRMYPSVPPMTPPRPPAPQPATMTLAELREEAERRGPPPHLGH